MKLTLLLDLDDTLLDSNMNNFIPAYFQALSGFLAKQVNPEVMLPALIAGTRRMMANTDPSQTLQQVFDAEFFSKIGVPRNILQPQIDQFYDDVFPTLSHLTQPRSGAVELVEWALSQGVRLAISTNPLFPLKAIHHRMTWAGLPPEKYPFEVISSYETFHFTKPNPAYLAEVLGRMGWPDGAVLAVGDDIELDLPAAHGLGLPTYWISAPESVSPNGTQLAGQGRISNLRPWLESCDLSTLEPLFSSPGSLIALMCSTPAILSWLDSRAHETQSKRRPAQSEWSLTEIFCHLRDTEQEVYLPRLRVLLEQDEPFIAARNTDEWAMEREYNNQDGQQAVQDFITARVQTLEIMRNLSDADWQRKARHAIFGPTNLQELTNFMAEHDRLHIRQAQNTLLQVES